MSQPGTGRGKVVVNRAMSLDGFIGSHPDAGPDAPRWPHPPRYVPADVIAAVAAETGAMLVGRRTWDVGDRIAAEDPDLVDYPFDGAMFLLTHRPPDPPLDGVTVLSGDIGDAVATALAAAGGRNLEILGADVATQCLQRGLVDELLVYVLPFLFGDGVHYSATGLAPVDLEPLSSERAGDVTVLRFRVRT